MYVLSSFQASDFEAKIQEQSIAELAGLTAMEHDLQQHAKVQHVHKITNALAAVPLYNAAATTLSCSSHQTLYLWICRQTTTMLANNWRRQTSC